MLKRNKGVGVKPNTSHFIRNDIIKQFNVDKRKYKRILNSNMRKLTSGKITKEVYLKNQKANIKEHFTKSFMAGKVFSQSSELKLSDDERRFIAYQTGQEMQYMSKFADDIVNGSGRMNYKQRMNMYADGVNPMFEFGNLAYLPEDIVIEWVLGRTDKHCIDCLSFAYGSPYTKKTLPGVPRSGNSRCLSNCRCTIFYSEVNRKPSMYTSYITNNYTSARGMIPTEADVDKLISMTDEFYYSRMTAVLTKDKADMKTSKVLKASLLGYVAYNDFSVNVPLPVASSITEFRTFMKSELFETVTDIETLEKGMLVSLFKGGKQTYGTVYSISGNNLVVSTLENKTEIINTNITHVFREIGGM